MANALRNSNIGAPQVAVAVVICGDRALMLRRTSDEENWTFPGGKIRPGEGEKEAAARELMEEVKINCKIKSRIGEREHPLTGVYICYYLFTTNIKNIEIKEKENFEKYKWMSAEEMEAKFHGNIYHRVIRALKRNSFKNKSKDDLFCEIS